MSLLTKWRLLQRATGDPSLTSLQMRLLLRIADRANAGKGYRCFPGLDLLAKELKASRQGVIKAIRGLESREYIQVSRAGGRSKPNIYLLNVAADAEQDTTENCKPAFTERAVNSEPAVTVSALNCKPQYPKTVNPSLPESLNRIPLSDTAKKKTSKKVTDPHLLRPENFIEWAADKVPGIDVATELESFVNHSDSKDRKHKDAAAAFRYWLLNAKKFAERDRQNGQGAAASETGPRDPSTFDDEDWRIRVQRFRTEPDAPWSDKKWGPKPGQRGCRVPARILDSGKGAA